MLSFLPGIQVFMAMGPVDMRKSFDGLSAAVRYLNNQWAALSVFLPDGRVPFDNWNRRVGQVRQRRPQAHQGSSYRREGLSPGDPD